MAEQISLLKEYTRIPLPVFNEDLTVWMQHTSEIIRTNQHSPKPWQFMEVDNKVVETREIVVHTFLIGDVDEPDVYAAEPLWNWQNSDAGKWVMNNSSAAPCWHRFLDARSYSQKYAITAALTTQKLTEYYLRFGKPKD